MVARFLFLCFYLPLPGDKPQEQRFPTCCLNQVILPQV
jgi:hypothetical protein